MIIDLTGQTFGTFRVLHDSGKRTSSGTVKWACECAFCDRKPLKTRFTLLRGTRCVCENAERSRERFSTHGGSKSPTWNAWSAMRRRCDNERNRDYAYYGGRGIEVSKDWYFYRNFLRDMGERPIGKTLDRIDPDGPYAKWNCRWLSHKDQMNNMRRNRMVTIGDVTLTLSQWADDPKVVAKGISYTLLRARLRNGWPAEEAIAHAPGESRRLD